VSDGKRPPNFKPFFLPASGGERFCILHAPSGSCRGAVLYVHPFGEEMNKSRRMAALQSRALAAEGLAVLQIDLFGCGDSSGDFSEASWEAWCDDVALGMRWLQHNAHEDVVIWGLRLGAVLAVHAAEACSQAPKGFLLWQPVLGGESMLTQFLRLRLASEMLAESRAKTGVQDLRNLLASGSTIEIAGYELTGRLAMAIDGLRLQDLAPSGRTHWFEIVAEEGRELPPGSRRVADAWIGRGVDLETQCVPGPQFWNRLEITDCPGLVTATSRAFAMGAG
jgi:exosortase A-associated hydrolase 2